MKYKCNYCKKEFDLPATITYRPIVKLPPNTPPLLPSTPFGSPLSLPVTTLQVTFNYEIQQSCCPYCYSIDMEEIEG